MSAAERCRVRVRGHVPPPPGAEPPPRPKQRWRPAARQTVLLVHCLTDPADRLVFANARTLILGPGPGALLTIGEGVFAPTERLERLRAAASGLRPDVCPGRGGLPLAAAPIEHLGQLVARTSYRSRRVVVGWDLPAQFGALAVCTGAARARRDGSAGGLSLRLAGTVIRGENGVLEASFDWPGLQVRELGAGFAYSWTAPKSAVARYRGSGPARFVDLRVLASALCGHDLDDPGQAAQLFGVAWPKPVGEPLARLRAETRALSLLYGALAAALVQVAPGLDPAWVFSFGTLATHALREAGVSAPLTRAAQVSERDLGAAAAAFAGGRFECRLPGVVLPLVLADIRSTYPSVFGLLGLGRFYAGEAIVTRELDVAELAGLLAEVAAGGRSVWQRRTWRRWGAAFATVVPSGQPLPVSAEFPAGGWRSVVAPLDLAGGVTTVAVADLLAAVVEDPAAAGIEILRVFEFGSQGVAPGLRPLRLPSGRVVDLAGRTDLGTALTRDRAALRAEVAADTAPAWREMCAKAVANALSFGLLARHDRRELARPVVARAIGPHGEPLAVRTRHPELPGPHCFLPAAAAVCAGARLLLALAARELRSAGSAPVALHADSLAVPCSPTGGTAAIPGAPDGTLRILSRPELDALLARFGPLGVRWSIEVGADPDRPSYGLAVGVNRLIFAQPDSGSQTGWEVLRSSDTGLGGALADPSDHPGQRTADGHWRWPARLQELVFATAARGRGDLERPLSALLDLQALPAWAERPALRRYRISTPEELAAVRSATGRRDVGGCVHYLRAATGGSSGSPVLLGAFPDPACWPGAQWWAAGRPVGLAALDPTAGLRRLAGEGTRLVRVHTVAEDFRTWLRHDDPTSDGPRRGLRQVRPVRSGAGLILVTGRDSAELAAADADWQIDRRDSARLYYGVASQDQLRQRVRGHGVVASAVAAGIPHQTVSSFAAGGGGSNELAAALSEALAALESQPRRVGVCPCGSPSSSRGRYCGATCRQRAYRAGVRGSAFASRAASSEPAHPAGWPAR